MRADLGCVLSFVLLVRVVRPLMEAARQLGEMVLGQRASMRQSVDNETTLAVGRGLCCRESLISS